MPLTYRDPLAVDRVRLIIDNERPALARVLATLRGDVRLMYEGRDNLTLRHFSDLPTALQLCITSPAFYLELSAETRDEFRRLLDNLRKRPGGGYAEYWIATAEHYLIKHNQGERYI